MDQATITYRGVELPVDLDTGRGQFRVTWRGQRVSAITLPGLMDALAEADRAALAAPGRQP